MSDNKLINNFTDEQKVSAFNRIANEFYNKNFGIFSKSNMETLMFSILINTCDNYNAYDLSDNLGIPVETVNNLAKKAISRYPKFEDNEWLNQFTDLLQNDKTHIYIEDDKLVIPISNPYISRKIRQVMEESGSYINIKRNENLLEFTPSSLFDFILTVESLKDNDNINNKSKLRKEVINNIKETIKNSNKYKSITDNKSDENILTTIVKSDGFSCVLTLLNTFISSNFLQSIITKIGA